MPRCPGWISAACVQPVRIELAATAARMNADRMGFSLSSDGPVAFDRADVRAREVSGGVKPELRIDAAEPAREIAADAAHARVDDGRSLIGRREARFATRHLGLREVVVLLARA